MAVKEVKELDEKVKEVEVVDAEINENNWEEDNRESVEAKEKSEVEKFSIGDTMLARGNAVDKWGKKSLEEEIYEGGDYGGDYVEDDYEDEGEFGEGEASFSYETMGQGDGDMYNVGSGSSGGDLYATGSGSAGDLYATGGAGDLYNAGKSDSVNMYNTTGGSRSESSLYNTGNVGGKKNNGATLYSVEGGKKKKFHEGGKRKRSELEGYISKGRKRKGVSMI